MEDRGGWFSETRASTHHFGPTLARPFVHTTPPILFYTIRLFCTQNRVWTVARFAPNHVIFLRAGTVIKRMAPRSCVNVTSLVFLVASGLLMPTKCGCLLWKNTI